MTAADVTRELYESMSPATLRELRHAFELDYAAHAANGETITFCANRIALIDSVLAARLASASEKGRQ